jgi:hypothetical protein
MMSTGKNRWLEKSFAAVLVGLGAVIGCAPQRPYRPPPPVSIPQVPLPAPQPAAPSPPPVVESTRRPVMQDSAIREQDIRSKAPPPPSTAAKELLEPAWRPPTSERGTTAEPPEPPSAVPAPLPEDSSLLAKIIPGVPPQRAASLRLTEQGRLLIAAGEPARALTPLERTIVVDSTNPYGYFYLAKAHHLLGRFQESMNFLDVAESRLGGEPYWLAEVHALRGENFRAQGQSQRAAVSYQYALRLNSGNRTAAEGLTQLHTETRAPAR